MTIPSICPSRKVSACLGNFGRRYFKYPTRRKHYQLLQLFDLKCQRKHHSQENEAINVSHDYFFFGFKSNENSFFSSLNKYQTYKF